MSEERNKGKGNRQEQQKFMGSITAKIILLVMAGLIVTFCVTIAVIIPKTKSSMQTAIENNMLDQAELYSELVDGAVEKSEDGTVTTEELKSILGGSGLTGYESSYGYLVDTEGVFLYSKREDKIGTTVLNENILQLLKDIPTGNYEPSGVFHYTDENGLEKYASYQVSEKNHWTMVVLGSESEVMASINMVRNLASLAGVIILIICTALTVVFARGIANPIRELTEIIQKTAKLDFTEDDRLEKLKDRKDETGRMCKASIEMQHSLQKMVKSMEVISKGMNHNAGELKEISVVINDASESNSATAQELAAYMEETSATTENITTNIDQIHENTTEISQMSGQGVEVTDQLMERASEMNETSQNTRNHAVTMCNDVKVKSAASIERSKAVEKINVLTNTIMSIADQTGLLALNASIEAARAGEQGKGFAVVAGEIGSLANQSSDAVQSIVEIVKEVQDAVEDMTKCLEQTNGFIEDNVIPDYESFLEGSRLYKEDASAVKESMNQISEKINILQKSSEEIAQAIGDINNTIGEEAQGITDIAQKTTDVVNSSQSVREMVDVTAEYAGQLKDIVEEFIL